MATTLNTRSLTEEQIETYRRDGAVAPVPMMTPEEAARCRENFERLEETIGGEAQTRYRMKAHLAFPWLTELLHHPKMLDAIEDLIGPDILAWGSSFFTKNAHDPRFVSWHQDSTYYGIDPPESITAWIAFSRSKSDSGCMRIVPGSHRGPSILPHVNTYDPDNLLSRGQTIQDVDESNLVDLALDAGEFSIHHNKTIHSSLPNTSDDARIGFAIHFATPELRQAQFESATATLVRGEDTVGNWLPDPVPSRDFDPDCLDALDEAWERYKTAMKAQT